MTNLESSQLHSTLEGYRAALVALEDTNESSLWQIYLLVWTLKCPLYISLTRYIAARLSSINPAKEQILDVLIARDAVQTALLTHSPPPRWSLLKVNELDNCLKGQSISIVQDINLADWRSLINPPPNNWWWFLDESPFLPQNQRDPIWKGLSILLLTISFGFGTSIYSAWFSIGLDALGSFLASAQGVITLFLGSRLFKTEENKPLFGYSKIPRHVWHQSLCQLSFLLTGSVLGLYFLQPIIADKYFTNRGINYYNAIPRQIARAKTNFERATKLDPDNAVAHYGLGSIYEELGKIEQAQAEYEIATQGEFSDAYNNLARLYILKQQSDKAAVLLNQGLIRVSNREVEYSLRKNLGWARLEQKRYDEAKTQLKEAIQLTDDLKREGKLKQVQAAPYCLLAQVLEQQKNKLSEAQNNWQNCKQYANPSNSPEEDLWLHLANQQLKKPGKPSCDTDC